MNARLIGTAFMLLILHGGVVQADPPGDSPSCRAREERVASAMDQTDGQTKDSAPQSVEKLGPPAPDDPARRVRELIYFFRTYRVFSRDEEWAQTIRELATIGKPAVPELVAELDRMDRDATLRSLAFSLRAIGDPRAVPALIRAIPKALRPPGSDCGVGIIDPDLRRFMKAHQKDRNDRADSVACGRPVNEILSALERITNHCEPPNLKDNDPLRHVFLGGTPQQQAQQRALFDARRQLWQAWWSKHWQEFVTKEELRSAELPRRKEDLVEKAGVARYGPLFPTGANVRLGPVRMLRLTESAYWNGRSHLDFDTGRIFQQYQGMKPVDWGNTPRIGSQVSRWYRRNGIDARCQDSVAGVDLQLWLIDNDRWNTLEAEIQQGEPLPLGREATDSLIRFDKTRIDFKRDELATFLFTTREGGRGIVQVFPRDQEADRFRVRYRMWLTSEPKSTAPESASAGVAKTRPASRAGTSFGRVVTTTLDLPVDERKCMLDLETGRKIASPEFLGRGQFADFWLLSGNEKFMGWCRENGIDVFGHVYRAENGPATANAASPEPLVALVGIELIQARVVPQTFDEQTVEEVREILERIPFGRTSNNPMMIDTRLTERPDTFAFETREGTVGVLQVEPVDKEAKELRIRYRLERRH